MELSQNPVGYSTNSLNLLPQSIGEGGKNSLHLSQLLQPLLWELGAPAYKQSRNSSGLGNSSLDLRFYGMRFHSSHLDSQTPGRVGMLFPDAKEFPKKICARDVFPGRRFFFQLTRTLLSGWMGNAWTMHTGKALECVGLATGLENMELCRSRNGIQAESKA